MNRTLIFLIAISVFASCKKSSNNDDTSNQKCRLSSWHTQGEHNYKFHYNNNNQLTEINWIDDYYGTFRKCTFNYYQDKITYKPELD